jgi:hypothetical protein
MAPQCPYGTSESPRYVVLIGPALFNEVHHRVRLGHVVADGVLRDYHAGSENYAVTLFGPDQAAVVDDHCVSRRRQRREKIILSDCVRHGDNDTHGAEKSGQVWVRTLQTQQNPNLQSERPSAYVRRSEL